LPYRSLLRSASPDSIENGGSDAESAAEYGLGCRAEPREWLRTIIPPGSGWLKQAQHREHYRAAAPLAIALAACPV